MVGTHNLLPKGLDFKGFRPFWRAVFSKILIQNLDENTFKCVYKSKKGGYGAVFDFVLCVKF